MNLNDLKTFIEEILENPEGIKDVGSVMEKALGMYKELSEMFLQATPEERTGISKSLIEIGKLFEDKLDGMAKKLGMTKEELMQSMQDPKNYSSEVWESMQGFQKNIEQEKNSLVRKVANKEVVDSEQETKIKKINPKSDRIFA